MQSKFFRLAGARRSDEVERNLAVTIDVKARDDRRCVVLARLTGKPEGLRCGEDFIWESLLSQGKSARQHKGSKSQPVILGFFMFLSYAITEDVLRSVEATRGRALEGSSDQRSSVEFSRLTSFE